MIMIMDPNKLIGSGGGMPWNIPSEMQYFKATTMGKPVIMGRKTFESLKRPLVGRTNIVVTSRPESLPDGVLSAADLDTALQHAEAHLGEQNEAMVIGGAALCREAMPRTEKLYLTELVQTFEGDTWLDSFDEQEWREVSRDERLADGYDIAIRVLERAF